MTALKALGMGSLARGLSPKMTGRKIAHLLRADRDDSDEWLEGCSAWLRLSPRDRFTKMKRISVVLAATLLVASLAGAEQLGDSRLPGEGTGIVFSPDLSTPGNRAFYEALGFTYFEEANWYEVIRQIERHNRENPATCISTLIIESHGTNGHGLKLQKSKMPGDSRSYASVGGLQKSLADSGVSQVLISACNSGRLFRPEIYDALNTSPGDPLFLPPTNGMLEASVVEESSTAETTMLRREQSGIETLIVGNYTELPTVLRTAIAERSGTGSGEFVISTMLIQRLLGDSSLTMVSAGYETSLSRDEFTSEETEQMLQRFLSFLHRPASDTEVATAKP